MTDATCIVSIDRHYLHLMVCGKETKTVEFGAKVDNNIQINDNSFLEQCLLELLTSEYV